jgi:hypothetical protein
LRWSARGIATAKAVNRIETVRARRKTNYTLWGFETVMDYRNITKSMT